MLTNPRYAGRAVYCGKVTGQAGQWEAIVGEEQFDIVAARLADPRRASNRHGTDRKHLGSSLYLCGVCSTPVRSHSGDRYRCPEGRHVTRTGSNVDELVRGVIRARLARPGVADLLAQPEDNSAALLGDESRRLRDRLASVEADYDAGLIDGRRIAVATEKVRAELAAVERQRMHTAGAAGLAPILGAPDPGAAFDAAPLGAQRATLEALVTVTLLSAPRGPRFDPASVRIDWRTNC